MHFHALLLHRGSQPSVLALKIGGSSRGWVWESRDAVGAHGGEFPCVSPAPGRYAPSRRSTAFTGAVCARFWVTWALPSPHLGLGHAVVGAPASPWVPGARGRALSRQRAAPERIVREPGRGVGWPGRCPAGFRRSMVHA